MEKINKCDDQECNEDINFKENPLIPISCGHNLCLKSGLQMIKEKNENSKIYCPECKQFYNFDIDFFDKIIALNKQLFIKQEAI